MIQISNFLSLLESSSSQLTKELIKLASFDVLKSLGEQNYKIALANKEIIAKSQTPLQVGESYLAKLEITKKQTPKLSSLIKLPHLQKELVYLNKDLFYDIQTFTKLFRTKESIQDFQAKLFEELAKAQTKEQFHATSTLLLSFGANIITIPLLFHSYFGFIQLQKRYNKQKKHTELIFYALFESLGPLSGVIAQSGVTLKVAYEHIKELLEANKALLGYNLQVIVTEEIIPLFETKANSLLDMKV